MGETCPPRKKHTARPLPPPGQDPSTSGANLQSDQKTADDGEQGTTVRRGLPDKPMPPPGGYPRMDEYLFRNPDVFVYRPGTTSYAYDVVQLLRCFEFVHSDEWAWGMISHHRKMLTEFGPPGYIPQNLARTVFGLDPTKFMIYGAFHAYNIFKRMEINTRCGYTSFPSQVDVKSACDPEMIKRWARPTKNDDNKASPDSPAALTAPATGAKSTNKDKTVIKAKPVVEAVKATNPVVESRESLVARIAKQQESADNYLIGFIEKSPIIPAKPGMCDAVSLYTQLKMKAQEDTRTISRNLTKMSLDGAIILYDFAKPRKGVVANIKSEDMLAFAVNVYPHNKSPAAVCMHDSLKSLYADRQKLCVMDTLANPPTPLTTEELTKRVEDALNAPEMMTRYFEPDYEPGVSRAALPAAPLYALIKGIDIISASALLRSCIKSRAKDLRTCMTIQLAVSVTDADKAYTAASQGKPWLILTEQVSKGGKAPNTKAKCKDSSWVYMVWKDRVLAFANIINGTRPMSMHSPCPHDTESGGCAPDDGGSNDGKEQDGWSDDDEGETDV